MVKMKRFGALFSLFIASVTANANPYTYTLTAKAEDALDGYMTTKIWLNEYAMPQISLHDLEYTKSAALKDTSVKPAPASSFKVILGKERTRPFAVVQIPAYKKEGNVISRLNSVSLIIDEAATPQPKAQMRVTATTQASSPLANGTWYKVSVSNTGFCKVDYDFLSSKLGVSNISSANIRLFGNGGNMLPEGNGMPRKDGLQENAIWMSDGGDGNFGPGDYFVFYAVGPDGWQTTDTDRTYRHTKNIYEDKAYYFLNFDQGAGIRIIGQGQAPAGNATVNSFDDHVLYEQELNNPQRANKRWWGEEFANAPGKSLSHSVSLDLGGNVQEAKFNVMLGSRGASLSNTFTVVLNGQQMGSYPMAGSNFREESIPLSELNVPYQVNSVGNTANFTISYRPTASDATGYLDYIEAITRRGLAFTGSQISFRDWRSVGAGNIATYELGNANSGTQVWDITDPQNPIAMNGSLNGSTYTFTQDATTLHEFAALKDVNVLSAEYVGKVDNQNLHASAQVDYIIIAPAEFLGAANQLADFHRQRSGMRVIIATPQQVYNEFSSGSQDISAIRDFTRMFYLRAGTDVSQMPKNLLLFGDASYDYKNRLPNNTNVVPTFESGGWGSAIDMYCNDDFFTFLDDNEDIQNGNIINTMDIGVGRFPVNTAEQAQQMIEKVKHYKSAASLGKWRLANTFVADNEDRAGEHLGDAEAMDSTVIKNSNIYNNGKVYLDITNVTSTPAGARAPDANKLINDNIYKGTFMINYSGHGNTEVWADERILTSEDYNKWKNMDKLPFIITATCDFGRFDHPEYVSAGEALAIKPDGGCIAAITTTQLVFAGDNKVLNQDFLSAQFEHVNGTWNTFGEALMKGKNITYARTKYTIGLRKFALFGDPALEPDFPEHFIQTESIIDGATGQKADSIGALGEYTINGKVVDKDNNLLDFTGRLDVTFFDKPRTVKKETYWNEKEFKILNNVIYRGKATVTNGKFSVSFITPKDINYEYGKGKVSYYAENGETDAAGSDFNPTVGGFSDNPRIEENPPLVRAFIGDSLFRNGGLTGANTLLYAILEDETGINVSGNSIGHDLVAILDDDVANQYIMNDYYETAPNTYKRGFVSFPLANLPDGKHRMTIKAWDVNNNSGVGYVDFEVANGSIVKVQELVNYPNPFSDKTHFRFEHNHPDEAMATEINIYTSGGSLVRTLKQNFTPTGSHSDEIIWDGTTDTGALLPSGVYLYRMKITSSKGSQTLAYQKMVITR
jgi:hypothetical protein